MAGIKLIEINQFRGIRKLVVSDFSRINLIVGDNNCGKTTFLEAIQLLFTNAQMGSVKNIIKQRTVLNPNDTSFYVSFINMFNANQKDELLNFDIYAESDKDSIETIHVRVYHYHKKIYSITSDQYIKEDNHES